eukprot:CAMPEP_0185734532 /NCGR_PEP_ID=MMETSP1171-20130828/22801_1 /TAXON_ID=374046 /ORGANISM="Helicotheca tamensis, Strain CCMP826" /LENGTH=186 /DNA_ID=CAMNT_0028404549 /DNA_START=163 /DNA_END=723 /DNA_ORIENTATION=+
MTMRKGRPSLKKTINAGLSGSPSKVKPMGGDEVIAAPAGTRTNWVPVAGITSMKDLPQEENVVKLVDTKAPTLMNGATNPTGAVAIINYEGKTYCFSSSCSSCQIPLTKAKVLPPNDETDNKDPRLVCDFCKATYNIRTGEVLEDAGEKGFVGGIVSGLISSKGKVPLPTYDLGEQNGKVFINLPY